MNAAVERIDGAAGLRPQGDFMTLFRAGTLAAALAAVALAGTAAAQTPTQPVARQQQNQPPKAGEPRPAAKPAAKPAAPVVRPSPLPQPRQAAAASPVARAVPAQAAPSRAFGCDRPGRPALPSDQASQGQIDQSRSATLDYFRNADAYRACLDRFITAERDKMFRDNTPETPELKAAAGEHSGVSQEKAAVFERFVLLCYAWEDRNRRPYPSGCSLPANPT